MRGFDHHNEQLFSFVRTDSRVLPDFTDMADLGVTVILAPLAA